MYSNFEIQSRSKRKGLFIAMAGIVCSGGNAFEPGKRPKEAEQRIAGEIQYVTEVIDLLISAFADKPS